MVADRWLIVFPLGVHNQREPLPVPETDLVAMLLASDRGTGTNEWKDLSVNGNDFSSPSAGNFPTFSAGVAIFNGSSTYLTSPSGMMSGAASGEIFFRHRALNSGGGSDSGWKSFGTHTDNFTDHYTYFGNAYSGFGSTTRKSMGGIGVVQSTFHTANVRSASGAFSFHTNGTQRYSTGTNTVAWSSTSYIGRSWNGNVYFNGEIKCVLIYRTILSSGDRTTVLNYLSGL